MNNIITPRDFIHPLDHSLSARIMNFPVLKQLMDIVFEKKLDSVNSYFFQSSCIMFPEKHPVTAALRDGEKFFNIGEKLQAYSIHSYDFDVKIIGYNHPVVLVSSRLLEENNGFLLRERVATAAAAVNAGHHKLDFLLWIYDNFSGIIRLPVLNIALTGLINEWKRSRQYTLDRAFLVYTKNFELSKKNILYGQIPYSIFKTFNFKHDDIFQDQVNAFYKKDDILKLATTIQSILQYEIWIPSRYKELCDFYKGV